MIADFKNDSQCYAMLSPTKLMKGGFRHKNQKDSSNVDDLYKE